ncbi:interleukin-22 [Neophocaena asiaeorientalis asiaeorientalis]|uniref:Interleukin-22 n=2 Tax=Phocoenidae TaxID=9740 RepID=A0A341ATC2_NEOAA|nr:interleukin-22 [Neophocaena asiaeorientalis asiaeorientalis]XP_032502399.1 interleukin-22 [Phocoena sinus]
MAARQKSMSSSLMGTLVASCLLHMALWVQGGAAVPIVSQCRLDRANFQQPYITNRTFALAHEASLADNNTDVRLIGTKLFQGVKMMERCCMLKQVLNFILEEVLLPQSNRFKPYMQEVVPFLARLNKKLGQCHMECDNQNIQRNVQNLKDTVKKLGESGEIKVIGELNLLFMALKNECTRPGQSSKMDN